MSYTIQRFPITADEITRVMDKFYTRVRAHDVLGPIFDGHIGTDAALWDTHIAKIDGFWRNALLREDSYSGNPMQVHLESPDIKPEHFAPWLVLFDQVLIEELPDITAQAWSGMAHRIARGFRIRMGDQSAMMTGGVPNLR